MIPLILITDCWRRRPRFKNWILSGGGGADGGRSGMSPDSERSHSGHLRISPVDFENQTN